jgi:hypothetical protein
LKKNPVFLEKNSVWIRRLGAATQSGFIVTSTSASLRRRYGVRSKREHPHTAGSSSSLVHAQAHVHAHEQSKVEDTSQVLTHVPMSGGAANARAYSRTRKHAHLNMRANVRKYKRVFTPPQQQMCTAGAGGWPGCTYLHPRKNAATNAFACVYTAKDSHAYTYNFARAHSKCIVTVRHTLTVLTCHAMYANRTRTCF